MQYFLNEMSCSVIQNNLMMFVVNISIDILKINLNFSFLNYKKQYEYI